MAHVHVLMGAESVHAQPEVRRIGVADLKDALARGIDDFLAMPTHAVFLCLIYPVVGILLGWVVFGMGWLQLLYPLVTGFALLGPFAAIGLYEMSRQREQGRTVDLRDAFDVYLSPSFGAIAALGLLLLVIFVIWLAVAQSIYIASFGYGWEPSIGEFVDRVLTTPEGRWLLIVGNLTGFLFALLVLIISVVSFPLLLDRDVGAVEAVLTSVRAVRTNPVTMAIWGLIVAGLLVLGSLPFLAGLAVVMPVLGHSTWHLYRKMINSDMIPPPERSEWPTQRRHYAAQFPAAIFAGEDRRDRR
jgi:uncharacterized membrane protein